MKKVMVALLSLALFSTVQAQEEKAESKNKPSADIENLQLAYQLANYGYRTFSAAALIEAAKIMSSITTQKLKYDSFKQDPAPKAQDTKKSTQGYDLVSILDAAKKYSDGKPELLAEIAAIEKGDPTTRGRVGGPGDDYSYVYGNSRTYYDISFRAGELAEILVRGDGDTDLDLYVYDSLGNLIDKDDDYTDLCYVCWVPKWTGRYSVKIVNRGPILNNYHIVTN